MSVIFTHLPSSCIKLLSGSPVCERAKAITKLKTAYMPIVVKAPENNAFNGRPLFFIMPISDISKPIERLIKINTGDTDNAKKPRLIDIKVFQSQDGLVQRTKNKLPVLLRSKWNAYQQRSLDPCLDDLALSLF